MNRTITLPEIAAQTALSAAIDNDTATHFIVSLFAAVESSLAADGTATIKGIGTFKRDAAAPGGVRFTPEKALAEAVNAPFSAFAPVPLPDNAPADIFADEDTPAEDTPAEDTPVPASEVEPEPEPVPYAEPVTEPEEELLAEPDIEAQPDTTAVQEAEPQPGAEPQPEIIYVTRRSPWPWIAAVAMLVIGFAAGFLVGNRNSAIVGIEPLPDSLMAVAASPDTVAVAAPAADAPDTIAAEPAEPDTIAVVTAAQPQQKEPVYDTVSSTRFLTTIARDHYGRKDFWVFIYEANADKLRHPNRIRPGTRVLIPDLGEHAALDAATRKRAHELATEIYNRYDMN